jgi:hypothetical protein
MEKMRNAILVRKPEGKRPIVGPSFRWKYTTKMNIKEQGITVLTGFVSLRQGPVAVSRECGNETSCFIRVGALLDCLNYGRF